MSNPAISSVDLTYDGTYTVTASNSNSGCSATATTVVTVNTIGVAPTNNSPACVGGTVGIFSGETGTAPGVAYAWSGPSGHTFTVSDPAISSVDLTYNGTYTITASNSNSGCSATATTVVTVNTLGITATNSSPACVGGTVTLSSTPSGSATPTGYAWSGPLVFGAATQNTTLTTSATTDMSGIYTVTVVATGSNCIAINTTNVTVNTLGIMAANDAPACVGGTVNFTATPTGTAPPTTYAWRGPIGYASTSQNPSISGVILAMAGVYTVTVNAAGSACTAATTTNVVVNTLSITASNNSPTCAGLTTTLNSTPSGTAIPTGYSWGGPLAFSAGTQNITIPSITTAMTGTYTVTVTAAGSACTASATTIVTVIPVPAPITGLNSVCVGLTTTLSDLSSGGVWSSTNTGIATIGSSGSPRTVTGLYAGTTTISFTVGTGCASTTIVTVNPNPVITGMGPVCIGSTLALSDNISGGMWTAANTHASVGSSSGVITGLAVGTDNITYTLPTTCLKIAVTTVNAAPSAIGGTPHVCQGQTTTLNTTSGGGTWVSGNPSVASVGSTGGTTTVTGILAGTSVVSYILPTGCYSTIVVTVNGLAAITGNAPVCQGSTVTLSDLALGGTWVSGSLAIATVGSVTGVVTGVAGGTTHISYSTFSGCLTVVIATVNPTGTIMGTAAVCAGGTTSLSDATAGGTWSSSSPANATVGTGAGLVTGVAAGTTTISYMITATGCTTTRIVTVNVATGAITGTGVMCAGSGTTLSDPTSGGTWSSASPGIATVGSTTGAVNGVAAGTSTISYKMAGGCYNTTIVTVNTMPGAITGNAPVCQSATVTLHDGTAGGSWSTSAPSIATVGSTGIVSGAGGGTAIITYGMTTGCQTSTIVTVNPISPITGAAPVCVGSSVALTDATPGGNWTSSAPTKGSVDASGNVTGLISGVINITYTMPGSGCKALTPETINALPASITGTMVVCSGGSTVTLDDATAGGTWSSVAGTGNVSVDGSGNVMGTATGTATVSYVVSGCGVATTVTVNSSPAVIAGNTPTCAGLTLALVETVGGGTWSSSTPATGTVNSAGVVTAIAGGTTTISYVTGAGCSTTAIVTVNTILPITGLTNVCLGSTTNLADGTAGGTWSSASPTTASVGTSGIVTGNAVGSTTISYTTASCTRTAAVNVNPVPSPIAGTLTLCNGATTTLSDDGSGAWSSANIPVASVSSAGVVTGASAGTATIKYTSGAGCFVSAVVTVNAGPSAIGGAASVCAGSTISLSDFLAGGAWSTTDLTVSVVSTGSTTASVTGVSAGSATITYTAAGTGCLVTHNVAVNTTPAPVSGNPVVCIGRTTFVSDATTPGVSWTSSNTGVATVSGSGAVMGVSSGTAGITYSIGTGCTSSIVVTVNALPAGITGNAPMCIGNSVLLNDASGSGTWSSNNGTIATVGTDGTVTGVSGGNATITYAVNGAGCYATAVVTVTAVTPITGPSVVCTGSSITLNNTATGGTWSSLSGNVTVDPSLGTVSGVTAGSAVITYTFAGGGCSAMKTVSVNTTPTAINGLGLLCVGTQLALTDGVTGGVWSSSNSSVASAVGSTGVVTGMALGTATITYNLSGCHASAVVSVNSASPVTGFTSICVGAIANMHNTVTGGAWTSSNTAVGTISTGGVLSGLIAGTTTVSYTLTSGCVTTATVTVNPIPDPITGNGPVCVGGSLSLSDDIAGGTWYSSDGVVTIDGSGNVSAIAIGTAGITYTSPAGCITATVVTVGSTPATITGSITVCEGGTSILNDATLGGVWTSTSGNATIGSSTGVVTGVTAGTTTISYSLTGCGAITAVVTVNSTPAAITGSAPMCIGGSVALGETTVGGVWSITGSSASVDGSGNVTGISAGTATVSYSLGSCMATTVVTVAGMPAAITGASFVCLGGSTLMHDATPGGLWSSADVTVSVGTGTGLVTGQNVGTATITYTTGTGCTATTVISVNTATAPITGLSPLCIGTSTLYTDATSGGVWSSSNTSVASVGTDGTVSGVAAGNSTISYNAAGCISTQAITVSLAPMGITGPATVCANSTVALTDATAGGIWGTSSSNISINSFGIVTGVTAGSATVTYTSGAGCSVTRAISVNPQPSAINGMLTVCVGGSTFLSDATSGGVSWTSSNTSVATISYSGAVASALSVGTSTVTYSISTGCYITAVVSVNAQPSGITNNSALCTGTSIVLSDATGGGTWSSNNTGIASVGTDGTLTGVSGGNATITYATYGAGCFATAVATVNPLANAGTISGSGSVCAGSTTTFSDPVSGGVWSSSATTIATVNPYGVVSGLIPGTSTISYTATNSCGAVAATAIVTVNTLADAGIITGSGPVCVGSVIALTDLTGSGVWSSSNGNASVDASGNVTGVAAGTSKISYTVTNGCGSISTTTVVSVSPLPSAITGSSFACVGGSTTLHDATSGGAWSTADVTASVVSGTGVVSGISVGTATITYTSAASCITTTIISVNAATAAITGASALCVGTNTLLSDATPGGTWSTSSSSIATVGTDGTVTGVAAGAATISYVAASGCAATMPITVNPAPSGITGPASVCANSTVALSDATSGGTWSTLSTNISVDGSGNVSGITSGAASVTYTSGLGCVVTRSINVNPQPSAINGMLTVCVGSSTFLSDATSGGVSWTSSNTAVATVSYSGAVAAATVGTTTITYSISTGCGITAVVTVNAQPAGITNNSVLCAGTSIVLSDATAGGTWSSNNIGIASVGTDGTLTGVSGGNATITYAVNGAGCYATTVATVNPAPNAGTLSGTGIACVGGITTFSDAVSGGVWSSTLTGNATVNTSGVVTGVAAGTSTISYTVTNSCGSVAATAVVTVNPAPSAGTVSGSVPMCAGTGIALTDATAGGVWSSSNGNATVDGSGNVSGISGGTATISYTVSNSCGSATATAVVTVNAIAAITGSTSMCVGFTSALSDVTTGGTWSSSTPSIATVGSSTGLVTGIAGGTSTVVYTIPSGCTRSVVVTITSSLPPISGTMAVCIGSTTALTDAAGGGTWTSGSPSIATVGGSTGIVTGSVAGTAHITYTVGSSCSAITTVTVDPVPSGIGGSASVCIGSTITLSDLVGGGNWTSSGSISVAATGTTLTTVTPLSIGTGTVTYTIGSTGCFKTMNITVNSLPAPISGNLAVCGVGSVTFLTDATSGTSWAISPVGTATVSTSGRVYGVSLGTATVTFTGANTCKITAVVTVDAVPIVAAISGANNVSHGATITLSDATAGGVWSSASSTIASVDGSGDVTGVAASGTTTISYTVTDALGCAGRATQPITVHTPAPPSHTVGGTVTVYAGTAVNIADEITGGIWSSSNTNVATVDNAGAVTGITPGMANITHVVTNGYGESTTTVTPVVVSALPVDVRVVPNPNNGTFTVKGSLGTLQDEELSLEVTDVLGQVIYSNKVMVHGGKINEKVAMDNTFANGMYMLTVHSGTENKVFHFVIEK